MADDRDHAATTDPEMEAWRRAHPAAAALYDMPNVEYGNFRTRPSVRVWFPESMPVARIQTVNVGTYHEPKEALPAGHRPMVNIDFCGIDIGGPLDLIEAQFAAAVEQLVEARRYADDLEAEASSGRSEP